MVGRIQKNCADRERETNNLSALVMSFSGSEADMAQFCLHFPSSSPTYILPSLFTTRLCFYTSCCIILCFVQGSLFTWFHLHYFCCGNSVKVRIFYFILITLLNPTLDDLFQFQCQPLLSFCCKTIDFFFASCFC